MIYMINILFICHHVGYILYYGLIWRYKSSPAESHAFSVNSGLHAFTPV